MDAFSELLTLVSEKERIKIPQKMCYGCSQRTVNYVDLWGPDFFFSLTYEEVSRFKVLYS